MAPMPKRFFISFFIFLFLPLILNYDTDEYFSYEPIQDWSYDLTLHPLFMGEMISCLIQKPLALHIIE